MSELVRFGVSLEAELLECFDALCGARGYASRSEALRDMIRQTLLEERGKRGDNPATGVLSLVYDHHRRELSQQLTHRQHDAHECIVATLHVHLDHHNCLEILVLRGTAARIGELADSLRAVRGVSHGMFHFTSSDGE
ncbi:MAG: nickel-responsive transcriptional regulator NikR [Deltaproteobacteria bacterium]|jgi:CopG family nickel-responsive transcriptional regulator|nr:nickel-responsive transcriptional regulator NikR [Deltaproteobacteria bacterium]